MDRMFRIVSRVALAVGLLATGQAGASLAQGGGNTLFLPTLSRSYTIAATDLGGEWTQEAGNAQRTGYSPIEPKTPWKLLWQWNASAADGSASCPDGNPAHGHCYPVQVQTYTVAGGGKIFVPASGNGLYGLDDHTGAVAWHISNATFNASPAYYNGYVYAGAADGRLFKIDAQTGSAQTYNAGSAINRGILVTGGSVFALTQNGQLHRVDAASFSRQWVYSSGSTASVATGLAYSASRGVIIFGTDDLYVHAVAFDNGIAKWRVKPTPHTPGFPYQFLLHWPVVAEQNGVVFVRMRLAHPDALWQFPRVQNNAEARSYLTNNTGAQNLFALDLDDGSKNFIPALGFSGPEDLSAEPLAQSTCGQSLCAYLLTGPVPVVKVTSDGEEVAYMPFRSQQGNPDDARWDAHMGEMVLNNNTIGGLSAGDFRFIQMGRRNSSINVADELGPISMAGDMIFHAHWGAAETVEILDRSDSRGITDSNPITTAERPTIIRRMQPCGTPNFTTHYTTCGMTLFNDSRYWAAPGFWTYWNDIETPQSVREADGLRLGYTYVSNDLIVVQGYGGDLMVFQHSGP